MTSSTVFFQCFYFFILRISIQYVQQEIVQQISYKSSSFPNIHRTTSVMIWHTHTLSGNWEVLLRTCPLSWTLYKLEGTVFVHDFAISQLFFFFRLTQKQKNTLQNTTQTTMEHHNYDIFHSFKDQNKQNKKILFIPSQARANKLTVTHTNFEVFLQNYLWPLL